MSKSTLTWYKSKARRIVKDLKGLSQKEIACEINRPQQTVSYRLNNVYQGMFEEALRLLDIAGYEVIEKENEEDV